MFKFRFPKDSPQYSWTNHIKNKMLFYGLSEQRILRVLKSPKRVEEGVAEGTTAAMQSSSTRKNPEEVWVMYRRSPREPRINADLTRRPTQTKSQNGAEKFLRKSASSPRKSARIVMISTWRYPGISKPGTAIPIPDEIREELGI